MEIVSYIPKLIQKTKKEKSCLEHSKYHLVANIILLTSVIKDNKNRFSCFYLLLNAITLMVVSDLVLLQVTPENDTAILKYNQNLLPPLPEKSGVK